MDINTETLMPLLTAWAIKIVIALLIFVVGKWISKKITGVIRKLMERAELDEMLVEGPGAKSFLEELVGFASEYKMGEIRTRLEELTKENG